MAKMFYTLDEAKAALGKNDEEIKQFAREGRLREFRDGQRLMFKADQVESLRGNCRRKCRREGFGPIGQRKHDGNRPGGQQQGNERNRPDPRR